MEAREHIRSPWKLELQAVVSCWEPNMDPLQVKEALLNIEMRGLKTVGPGGASPEQEWS